MPNFNELKTVLANLDGPTVKAISKEVLTALGDLDDERKRVLRSTMYLGIQSIISYGAVRRVQPIVQKLINGEPLTRRESRKFYGNVNYFVGTVASATVIGINHAARVDAFNNR